MKSPKYKSYQHQFGLFWAPFLLAAFLIFHNLQPPFAASHQNIYTDRHEQHTRHIASQSPPRSWSFDSHGHGRGHRHRAPGVFKKTADRRPERSLLRFGRGSSGSSVERSRLFGGLGVGRNRGAFYPRGWRQLRLSSAKLPWTIRQASCGAGSNSGSSVPPLSLLWPSFWPNRWRTFCETPPFKNPQD